MKMGLGLGVLGLAAGLAVPVSFAQTTPRARTAAGVQPVETPYLGVGGQDISSERAKALKLKEERGVELTTVFPDSAAAKGGLKDGDVVVDFNGEKVEGWEHLKRLVRETPVHRDVKVGVWRNGVLQTLTVNMGSQRQFEVEMGTGPMVFSAPSAPMPPAAAMPSLEMPRIHTMMGIPSLGIVADPLDQNSQLADFFGVKEGVLIRDVTRNSAGEKAGLKAGDVIVKIDETTVGTTQQINSALRAARSKGSVNVIVIRNRKEMTVPVTPDANGQYRGGLWFSNDGNDSNWFVMQGGDDNLLKRLFVNDGAKPAKIDWK